MIVYNESRATVKSALRETVVLDLFIALKVHGDACDVWAELHLGSRKPSTTFSISCSSAHDSRASYAPISLRCASTLLYPCTTHRDASGQSAPHLGRSLMSNRRRMEYWRWRPSALPGSSRSTLQRGNDNFSRILFFGGMTPSVRLL